MPGYRILYDAAIGKYQEALNADYQVMARAATMAVRDVGISTRNQIRRNMTGAGFPSRWANSVGARFKPSAGQAPSIDAKVTIASSINFLGVFENGATIGGKPLLWLPLPDIPQKVGGQAMRPALFKAKFGPLRSARHSPIPLLLGQIAVGSGGLTPTTKKTAYRFKRAATAKQTAWVPVFVGITQVQLKKRLQYLEILKDAQSLIQQRYDYYVAQFTR